MSKLQVTTHRTPSVLATRIFGLTGAINEGHEHYDLVAIHTLIKDYAIQTCMSNVYAIVTEHSLTLFEDADYPTLTINESNLQ